VRSEILLIFAAFEDIISWSPFIQNMYNDGDCTYKTWCLQVLLQPHAHAALAHLFLLPVQFSCWHHHNQVLMSLICSAIKQYPPTQHFTFHTLFLYCLLEPNLQTRVTSEACTFTTKHCIIIEQGSREAHAW